MSDIANTIYTKRNVTKDWLSENKFKLNKLYSDEDVGNVYTYRFHVFKYEDIATLDCELNYFESTNGFKVDVVRNFGEKNKYYPFYYAPVYNFLTKLKIQTRVLYRIIKAINKNYTKRDEFVSTAYYT